MGVLGSFGDEGVVGLQFECPAMTRDPALAEKGVILGRASGRDDGRSLILHQKRKA